MVSLLYLIFMVSVSILKLSRKVMAILSFSVAESVFFGFTVNPDPVVRPTQCALFCPIWQTADLVLLWLGAIEPIERSRHTSFLSPRTIVGQARNHKWLARGLSRLTKFAVFSESGGLT